MTNTIRYSALSIITLLTLFIVTPTTMAQHKIFMEIPGIEGESTQPDYEDWIKVSAYAQELTNPASTGPGGPRSGRASIGGIRVTKSLDKASPLLALACCQGTTIPSIRIVFLSQDQSGQDYAVQEITITNVIVQSLQAASSTATGQTEEVIGIYASAGTITWLHNESGLEEGWDFFNNVRL